MQNQEQKVSSLEQPDATKLKKRRNPIKFVVFSFLLVIILLPVAVGLAQIYQREYRLYSGASKNTSDLVAVATLNATCKIIVNNSGVDYFVPANSASEYNSFIAAAPRLSVAVSPCSNCGDSECGSGEDALNCPQDCTFCGDAYCTGSETCDSCAGDCGECPPVCGDYICNGSEDCSSCPGDCGSCSPNCSYPMALCPDPSLGDFCYDVTTEYCCVIAPTEEGMKVTSLKAPVGSCGVCVNAGEEVCQSGAFSACYNQSQTCCSDPYTEAYPVVCGIGSCGVPFSVWGNNECLYLGN